MASRPRKCSRCALRRSASLRPRCRAAAHARGRLAVGRRRHSVSPRPGRAGARLGRSAGRSGDRERCSRFEFKDLAGSPPSGEKATLELLKDVDLNLRIELGRTQMFLEDVLKLKRGSVVTLDKLAGDPVDVFVNGRMVARGEVLVLNDNFCVRVTELLAGDDFD